jgi:hypothetical protein
MKSVVDLNANDFPGINPEKFHEWKTAALRIRKNWQLFFVALVLVNLIVIPLAGRIVISAGLLPLLTMFLVNYRPAKVMQTLGAELGLDPAALRDARRGTIPARFRGVAS